MNFPFCPARQTLSWIRIFAIDLFHLAQKNEVIAVSVDVNSPAEVATWAPKSSPALPRALFWAALPC